MEEAHQQAWSRLGTCKTPFVKPARVKVLACICALILCGTVQAQKATTLYDKVKDSILKVQTDVAEGTGFLCLSKSTVVTAYHVIKGAKSVVVTGTKGASWKVVSVQYSESSDLAILTLDRPSTRKVLSLAGTEAATGERVFVLGNPLGLDQTIVEGIIAAKRKIEGVRLLQTTAPISPGSSGSPMMRPDGSVLGVISYSFTEGQLLNMAVSESEVFFLQIFSKPTPFETFVKEQAVGRASGARTAPAKKLSPDPAFMRLCNEMAKAVLVIQYGDKSLTEQRDAFDGFRRAWESYQDTHDIDSPKIKTFGGADTPRVFEDYCVALNEYLVKLRERESAVADNEKKWNEAMAIRDYDAAKRLSFERMRMSLDSSISYPSTKEIYVSAFVRNAYGIENLPDIFCYVMFSRNMVGDDERLVPDHRSQSWAVIARDLHSKGAHGSVNDILTEQVLKATPANPFNASDYEALEKSLLLARRVARAGNYVLAARRKGEKDWKWIKTWKELLMVEEDIYQSGAGRPYVDLEYLVGFSESDSKVIEGYVGWKNGT